jgi:hypothetical protein
MIAIPDCYPANLERKENIVPILFTVKRFHEQPLGWRRHPVNRELTAVAPMTCVRGRVIARSGCGSPLDKSFSAWVRGSGATAAGRTAVVRSLMRRRPERDAQAQDAATDAAHDVDRRGAGTHAFPWCGKRANSNARRRRSKHAIAERHAADAGRRLSRLWAFLPAWNDAPLGAVSLLVRALLLTSQAPH